MDVDPTGPAPPGFQIFRPGCKEVGRIVSFSHEKGWESLFRCVDIPGPGGSNPDIA